MVGVQLVTTAVALVVVDAVQPRRSALGWIKEAKRRYARTRRYAQVSAIATRNGLVRQVRVWPNFSDHERNAAFARSLRRTLEEAGVTFVKLGQLLSTRDDLLPPEFTDELRGYLPHSGSVFAQLSDELQGYSTSSGALRFGVDEPLPVPLVKKLIAVRLRQAFAA